MIYNSAHLQHDGSTKYYRLMSGGAIHADKYCSHIKNKQVVRIEEHQISSSDTMCSHCTCADSENSMLSSSWQSIFSN